VVEILHQCGTVRLFDKVDDRPRQTVLLSSWQTALTSLIVSLIFFIRGVNHTLTALRPKVWHDLQPESAELKDNKPGTHRPN
jgi:hypothetical protein